jgi:hypothetical protein
LFNSPILRILSMLTKPAQECLGALVFSSCVAFRLENDFQFTADITNMIQLFRSGDWGDLDEDDWKFNIQTCKSTSGGSLMGCYKTFDKTKIWIITSGYGQQNLGRDYCYTTVLFPEEY